MNRRPYSFPQGNPANIGGLKDSQNWSFYDTLTYVAAGQQSLRFFQNPLGSVVGSTTKTKEHTNFRGVGQLPAGYKFVVEELQLMFRPGTTVPVGKFGADVDVFFVKDVYAFGRDGVLEFGVGDKFFVQEGPLGRFPPDTRLGVAGFCGVGGEVADVQTLVNYAQWEGRPFRLANVELRENQVFSIEALWPNGIKALPSTVDGEVKCFLRGVITRDVQ